MVLGATNPPAPDVSSGTGYARAIIQDHLNQPPAGLDLGMNEASVALETEIQGSHRQLTVHNVGWIQS